MMVGCYMVMGNVEWVQDCLTVFDESMVLMVFGGLGMFNGGCWRDISGVSGLEVLDDCWWANV